jgi:hypothetical protein
MPSIALKTRWIVNVLHKTAVAINIARTIWWLIGLVFADAWHHPPET